MTRAIGTSRRHGRGVRGKAGCTRSDAGQIEDGFSPHTSAAKKELIVTALWQDIEADYLEGLLAEDPLIAQVLVVGRRPTKYLSP